MANLNRLRRPHPSGLATVAPVGNDPDARTPTRHLNPYFVKTRLPCFVNTRLPCRLLRRTMLTRVVDANFLVKFLI